MTERIKKPFRKKVEIEFLNVTIWICFSNDIYQERVWWLKKINGVLGHEMESKKEQDENAAISTCDLSEHDFIMSFKFRASIDDIGHEAYHITRLITTRRGMEQEGRTDETGAYMCGWLTQRCVDVQRLANKKK